MENFIRNVILLCYCLLYMSINAIEEREHHAECHYLRCHPERKTLMPVAIFVKKMLNEDFMTFPRFHVNTAQPFLMFFYRKPWQVGCGSMAEWTLMMYKVIHCLRPDSHFNSFNGVHNDNPQAAVKGIVAPDLFKCCPCMKGVISIPVRVEIAAEAIIVYGAEAINQKITVSGKASAYEKIGLLFEGERLFRIFHQRP